MLNKFQDASLKWVPMSNHSIRKCKGVRSEFVWIFIHSNAATESSG